MLPTYTILTLQMNVDIFENLYLQHDGAPLHYTAEVHDYVNGILTEKWQDDGIL